MIAKHVLAISGSLRSASTNTAILRTAAAVAPPGVVVQRVPRRVVFRRAALPFAGGLILGEQARALLATTAGPGFCGM